MLEKWMVIYRGERHISAEERGLTLREPGIERKGEGEQKNILEIRKLEMEGEGGEGKGGQ